MKLSNHATSFLSFIVSCVVFLPWPRGWSVSNSRLHVHLLLFSTTMETLFFFLWAGR